MESLLIILAPPTLGETLTDWLLEKEQASGFSSMDVFGHGSRHSGMSVLEQVSGRQRRIQFMLHGEQAAAEALISGLRTEFPDAELHYMLLPVIAAGSI